MNKRRTKSHQDTKVCYICVKRFMKKFSNDKMYQKFRDHCHYAGNIQVEHITFVT